MSSVHWQARPSDDDGAPRRNSLLGVLALGRGRRVSRQEKGKQRASVDVHDVHEHDDDELDQLREAAARSAGLPSILPELGEGDGDSTVRRRPPTLDLYDKQAARDEAAAKLCGLVPPPAPPLPLVPVFPCAQSALAAHAQLSGPILKHHPPTALARLVGTKAWKPRHAVLCTYSLRNCTCAQPHRSSGDSICDAPTRTLACLHIFATPTPDALELARLVVTEDSVVFVVEPTLSPNDSRRGPRDVADRKWVIQVQGINGAPPPPTVVDRQPKRILTRRRESVGVATASLKSGISGRPRTVASLGIAPNSNSAPGLGSALNLTLDDDAQVHAVWFLQCPDADARQRWTSCIKRAVLLQRAERAGFGGTVHFTSARSVTDPLPSGDLDVVLALRAHAQSAQLRASASSPHPAPPILSQPVTPVAATFSSGLTSSFVPVFSPTSTTFSPTSAGFPAASDHSHTDALSLAFTRSQTPTYAPSVHTTHTTQTQPLPDRSRPRSSTVTNSAPVQALRGFFSLGSGGSRPPSRSASVTGGGTNCNIGGGKKSRNRAASSSATVAVGLQQSHPYAVPVPPLGHAEGQSPAPTSISFASASAPDQGDTYPYSQPPHPYGPVMLGTPISAGLGSMDLGDRDRERERERDELGNGVLGLNFGYGNAGLPGLGVNGLPGLGPNGISGLPALSGKSPVGSSGGKGMVTSLPPPPRARRAGSLSHVLPGRAQEDGSGIAVGMGRVQEESPSQGSVRGGRPHTTEGALRREDPEGGSRRPSLVPMMSLSFGQVDGFTESPSAGEDTDGEDEEQGAFRQREPRVLPPQLAPPSVPLPLPPGSWPVASDSSQASTYSVQTTSTSTGARVSDVRGSLDARGSVDGRGAGSANGLDRSRLSLGDGPRPNVDASWSRSRVSLGDVPRESPGASCAHSRVSLALVRGMLAEHPEGDGWDDGEGAGTGSYQESPTWTSVRDSPTRTRESPTRRSGRGTSPIAFTRRSTTDSVPSSPSSHLDGPAREGSSPFSRESFGSAFISRELESDQFHPFASQGQGRRAHRRAGSYGGPTLFTIADLPVVRSKSQRRKSEMLPPVGPPPSIPPPPVPPPSIPPPPVPPPNFPLPPLPVSSRPVTPVSRPRTPSRLGIASSQTPSSSAIQLVAPPVAAPQPRHTSLRTRLRMLSAPSPAPQSALPEPPRDLSALTEDDLAQPISKVPISLLVRDDSSARRVTNELGARREPEREGAPSLPPPPRIRIVRQHSHSASSDREGGIGQPLSLLLKQDKLVSSLSLYDIRGAPGVAADVSHVDTPSTVKGYPQDKLADALNGVKVVVIPAGVPRKPGMTRDDLFNTNAGIVRDLAQAVAENAPDAHILIISNPVNSTVPIAAEVLKKSGKFDPKRLFGVTTLDVVRAARFLSEVDGAATPDECPVTVVGGHSGVTIVPLLSQAEVGKLLSPESDKWKALVNRIQFGGDEVVKAKDGAGSATLSMAYAAAKFTNQLLRALGGEKGIVAPTFVRSPLYESEGVEYFSSAVELGTGGVGKIHPVGNVSPAEQQLIDACLPELKKNIAKGAKFVTGA